MCDSIRNIADDQSEVAVSSTFANTADVSRLTDFKSVASANSATGTSVTYSQILKGLEGVPTVKPCVSSKPFVSAVVSEKPADRNRRITNRDGFSTPASDIRLRQRAQWKIKSLLRNATIVRPKCCALCGNERRVVGHHPNYRKPTVVAWICYSCHQLTHRSPEVESRVSTLAKSVLRSPSALRRHVDAARNGGGL